MSFRIISSTPSDGYRNLAYTGNYMGALKQPPFSLVPPKILDYFLGRWETDGKSLSNFKQIQLGDGKTNLMVSGPVALANQFFLSIQNVGGFQPFKIFSYDPSTLTVTGSSEPIESNSSLSLQAANGLLFGCQNSTLIAYNPQFETLFQIVLDPQAFTIPFFAFTSDQIVCISCNGAVATYDFKGNSTSDTLYFNDHGANPWIVTTGDNLAVIGFYDGNNGISYYQSWELKPLAKTGPVYSIFHEYTQSAVNTAEGVLVAGRKVLFLGSYPAYQPNYTLYTFSPLPGYNNEIDQINLQTIVIVDRFIQFLEYDHETVPSAAPHSALLQTSPLQEATTSSSWKFISSFDLSSIVKGYGLWSIIGSLENGNLCLMEQESNTVYKLSIDPNTHKIALKDSYQIKIPCTVVNCFIAKKYLYLSLYTQENAYVSYRLDTDGFQEENIQIYNSVYPLDDQTFAGLYAAPLSPGVHKDLPNSTLAIYDADSLQVMTSFNISAYASNLNKVGEHLICVQGASVTTYNHQGEVIAKASTGFRNNMNHTGAIPVDDNHFLLGFDDNILELSSVQLWQANPLQKVNKEVYQIENFDITSIIPTPQGTILVGNQGIQYVGPNPNYSSFATVVQDASGKNVIGSCIALPNNESIVLNGNSLQLYQIGEAQTRIDENHPWCELQ